MPCVMRRRGIHPNASEVGLPLWVLGGGLPNPNPINPSPNPNPNPNPNQVSTTAVTWGVDVAGDAYESPVGLAAALVAELGPPFMESDVIWSALESVSGPKKGVWSVSVLLSAGSLQGAAGHAPPIERHLTLPLP